MEAEAEADDKEKEKKKKEDDDHIKYISTRNLEYGDEEHHECLQQYNFKKRSREENKIHLWT